MVQRVREDLRAEQLPAQGGVGPHPLLDAGHDHVRPFPSRGPGGGGDGHVVLRGCPGREGVHGQLLVVHVVHERPSGGPGNLVHEALGGLEQPDHRVQVPVRPHGLRSPGQRTTPPARPHSRGLPQRPQHGLRGGTGSVQRGLAGLEHVGDPSGGVGTDLGELQQNTVPEGLDEEVVARAPPARAQLVAAQPLPDAAHLHGGGATDPRGQQGDCRGSGEHGARARLLVTSG